MKIKTAIISYIFLIAVLCSFSSAATIDYNYDSLNRITKVDYGNGVSEDYSFDSAGNRLSLIVSQFDTTSPITTASPAGGTYNTTQIVTLTANETATIYNTSNGSTPTTSSPVYTTPINISTNMVLKYFAKDTAGNSEAVKTEVYVINIPQSNQPPIAEAGSDKSGLAGQVINFSGSGSSDSDGTIVSYNWNFGDGTTNSGVNVSHSYDSIGIYTATLTVTDNNGAIDEDTCMVVIETKPDILSITPNSGYNTTSTPITINGLNFDTTCKVYISSESTSIVGNVDTPDYAYGVYVSGQYAYVADLKEGLKIVDISDIYNPQIIGSVNTPGSTYEVCISGDYAYVTDENYGLQVVNISDLHNPVIVGNVVTTGAIGVKLKGNYAYVADWNAGLKVIDISVPNNPVIVGGVDTPSYAYGLYVTGDYAYIANGGALQIINISNSATPVIAGNVVTKNAMGVYVSGNYAYVADWDAGLKIINISNPSSPSIVSNTDTHGKATGVYVLDDYAYVSNYESGLQVIDISNPNNPIIIGNVDTPNYAAGVYVSGNYIFIADGYSGLQIIHKLSAGTSCAPVTYINKNTLTAHVPMGLLPLKYKIKVSNASGEEDTLNNAFTVFSTNELPVVTLTAIPNSGNAPLSVSLTADASDLDGTVVKYEWDFDNNGSYDLTTVNNAVSHTYNAPGKYNTKVRATDNDGATDETTTVVNVTTILAGNIDITSPGSANRVDGHDSNVLGRAFGSQPGDFNWNPAADLDENNIVNGNDLVIFAPNFGKGN